MFDEFFARGDAFDAVLLHADLGPEHVLRRGSELIGVLDWSNARIGDPALVRSGLEGIRARLP
jgi:hypothetical protein